MEHSTADDRVERAGGFQDAGQPSPRRSNRMLGFALIAALALSVAFVVAILNVGERQVTPEDAPAGWDDVDAVANPKPLDLGEGQRTATVVIGAADDLCWSGYISAQEIKGCGPQVFAVTGAGKTMGANVRHTETERAFLGLAIWTGDGDTQLERVKTRKPLGVAAITAYPNQPGAQ